MGDDLDDLLDEIESKMTKKIITQKLVSRNDDDHVKSRPPPRSSGGPRRQDLTDALDDIFDDGPALELDSSTDRPATVATPGLNCRGDGFSSSSSTKCFPLLIGGSGDPPGLSTTVSKRCCSSLRCFNCDFGVEMFDNYRWSPDTDYLFLRNNMPDFAKLQSRLLSRRQSRAYACQCQWTNAQEMVELSGELKRLWHCAGKHG